MIKVFWEHVLLVTVSTKWLIESCKAALTLSQVSSVVCDVLYCGLYDRQTADVCTYQGIFGALTPLSLCISIAKSMRHSFCIDRLLWGSTVGHPSNSWASCPCMVWYLPIWASLILIEHCPGYYYYYWRCCYCCLSCDEPRPRHFYQMPHK